MYREAMAIINKAVMRIAAAFILTGDLLIKGILFDPPPN